MIPQIGVEITNPIEIIPYPSYTFRWSENQIAGFVDDIDAIAQTVYHILNTERYAYPIYDDNYGVELKQYIGKNFSFVEATIENTLKAALTHDDRIIDINITGLERINNDSLNVGFEIITNIGRAETEFLINV